MNNWIVKSEIKSIKFGANENSEFKSESFVQNTILTKWALYIKRALLDILGMLKDYDYIL